jgi:hypothetical protein
MSQLFILRCAGLRRGRLRRGRMATTRAIEVYKRGFKRMQDDRCFMILRKVT